MQRYYKKRLFANLFERQDDRKWLQVLVQQDLLELGHADGCGFLDLTEFVVVEPDGFGVDEEDRSAGLDVAEEAGGWIDVERGADDQEDGHHCHLSFR